MTPSFSFHLGIFAALLLLLEPVLCRNISEIDLTDTNVSIFESLSFLKKHLKTGQLLSSERTRESLLPHTLVIIHADTNLLIVADLDPRRSSATKHRVIRLQTCPAYVLMWASAISGPVLWGMPQATRITIVSNNTKGETFSFLFHSILRCSVLPLLPGE